MSPRSALNYRKKTPKTKETKKVFTCRMAKQIRPTHSAAYLAIRFGCGGVVLILLPHSACPGSGFWWYSSSMGC